MATAVEKLWTTLWKTAEDRPGNASRHALSRIVPQALARTRAASPSARILGFSGVKHRTYSAKASASMRRHAQTRQQPVDNLWESPWSLWRKGALSNDAAVDKHAPGSDQLPSRGDCDHRGGCGRGNRPRLFGRLRKLTNSEGCSSSEPLQIRRHGASDAVTVSVRFPMMVR